mmetsp:Transcript_8112/g.12865  ORF Transcript_8112/g.12865 Transcript_8112/m.12865 type:complete len:212 (+) Transcript_8112:41-676(+)
MLTAFFSCCSRSRHPLQVEERVPGEGIEPKRRESVDGISHDVLSGPDLTTSNQTLEKVSEARGLRDERVMVSQRKGETRKSGAPPPPLSSLPDGGLAEEPQGQGNLWLNMKLNTKDVAQPASHKSIAFDQDPSVSNGGARAESSSSSSRGGLDWMANPLAKLSAIAPAVPFLQPQPAPEPAPSAQQEAAQQRFSPQPLLPPVSQARKQEEH